uniref:Uncharacterized protein n=1 Tax=Triticum urartu TaxID=4572 RepID=A0A8R7UNW0_TRIUA
CALEIAGPIRLYHASMILVLMHATRRALSKGFVTYSSELVHANGSVE